MKYTKGVGIDLKNLNAHKSSVNFNFQRVLFTIVDFYSKVQDSEINLHNFTRRSQSNSTERNTQKCKSLYYYLLATVT